MEVINWDQTEREGNGMKFSCEFNLPKAKLCSLVTGWEFIII